MKTFLLSLICLFLISTGYSETYRQVKVYLSGKAEVSRIADLGIDLEGSDFDKKDNSISFFVNEAEFQAVKTAGFSYTVLIDDWDAYYQKIPPMSDAELQSQLTQSRMQFGVTGFVPNGSMTGHFTLAELNAQLDTLRNLYPSLITAKDSIGASVQGRPLYMVKISNSPGSDNGKPEVLYTAIHHAREPAGMMTTLYYMYYLLENYNTNPVVKYLVDNRQMYFIPCVNPDGYEYNRSTNPTGGGMWRKNRRANTGGSFGVDPNRNYGPMAFWNSALAPSGSSTSPTSDTYRGTAPFSEPENLAILKFVTAHKFKTNFNYHTYGNYIIYPYGALARETPDSMVFREYAVQITSWNNYTYGTDMQTVNYSTRGGSDDFMYGGDTTGLRGKIFGMTPEVGGSSDNFWCPQNRILPIAQLNLNPNLFLAWVAGDYVSLQNAGYQQQYFNPGDNVQLKPTLKNRGLSTAYNISARLTSLSSYVTVTTSVLPFDSIQARSSETSLSSMGFTLAANAPIGQRIKLLVETLSGSVLMASDTISFVAGVPTYSFIDTTNNINSLWTITSSPANPKWEATTTSFVTTPNSYTDSKLGFYASNSTVSLTSTNPISLTGVTNPFLSFWTKYEIEGSWDCGVVQISTNNGSTWTALSGLYTLPASGQGKQVPAGMPIYHNIRDWVQEEMSLSTYANQNVKLRFELRTDSNTEKDGWYLDDIGIFTYTAVPVELTAFNVTPSDNKVNLSWTTATELNNRGFEVQRSREMNLPGSRWEVVSFINGKGTTQELSEYKFTDINPYDGKSYYRIKQVDYDGTYRLYGPVEVDLTGTIDYSLVQNYPNPFNPSTVIKYSVPQKEFVTIKLYNVLGAEVATLVNESLDAGRYSYNLNLNELKVNAGSGVYFYSITAGRFTQTRKLVVLK